MPDASLQLIRRDDYWCGRFQAMGSPCEVLLSCISEQQAHELALLVQAEALRIEHKYSRYRDDNIIHQINHAAGQPIQLDAESAQLLDYAQLCFQLSEGRFDITSGILRRVWSFDGSDHLPSREQIEPLLPLIGFQRLDWQNPNLRMPVGMEIDLGGIGKEYAVDRAALLLQQQGIDSGLVNFGGDIHVIGPRAAETPWAIAIEDPDQMLAAKDSITLSRGAMATSGDTHRFLLHDGIRYSHILAPTTGWSIPDAPRSVSVIASTCLEAGMLATFAMLKGAEAETFLQEEAVEHWVLR